MCRIWLLDEDSRDFQGGNTTLILSYDVLNVDSIKGILLNLSISYLCRGIYHM